MFTVLGGNHFYLVPKHLHLPKRTTCIHYAIFTALLFIIIIIIIHCINDYFLKENKTKQNPDHSLQNHLTYISPPPGASNQSCRVTEISFLCSLNLLFLFLSPLSFNILLSFLPIRSSPFSVFQTIILMKFP